MSYQFLGHREPVAKKRYVCDFCGKFILPGTKYVTQFAVDGDVQSLRAHPRCMEYMQSFIEYDGDDYPEFDQAECDAWHKQKEINEPALRIVSDMRLPRRVQGTQT